MTDMRALLSGDWYGILAAIVFAALATIGLFVGPAYAPICFGFGGIVVVAGLLRWKRPAFDRPLVALAILFAAWTWITALWSIDPQRTVDGALGIAGTFLGCVAMIAARDAIAPRAHAVLLTAAIAAVVGPVLTALDAASGYHVLLAAVGKNAHPPLISTKFDRGASYLLLLIWPLIGYAWRSGRRRLAVAVALAPILALASADAYAPRVAYVLSGIAFGFALAAPRIMAASLAIAAAVVAVALPFAVRVWGNELESFALTFRPSLAHRAEIWQFMASRLLDRPWLGWGWWTASRFRPTPEQLAQFRLLAPDGVPHPHDYWIQAWVETGLPGLVLGIAFALFAVWRAARVEAAYRPFALAAAACALLLSYPSFDLATDSWWAALAAVALLFSILPRAARA